MFQPMDNVDYSIFVPGASPTFGSVYGDPGIAAEASTDWANIIMGKLGRFVDMELESRFLRHNDHTPRQETGAPAGTRNLSATSLMPWLIGGGVVLAALLLLRK
jgi:hypothetical protein